MNTTVKPSSLKHINATEAVPQRLLTREQVAKRYAICPRYVADLVAKGVLPVVRLGRKCVRFPVAECDSAIEKLITGGVR